jgi:hypothetical protein
LPFTAIRLDEFKVTTGVTVATCTGAALGSESVVTVAVRDPASVGNVLKVTISDVGVAAVTIPTAPLFRVTTLSAAAVSKP